MLIFHIDAVPAAGDTYPRVYGPLNPAAVIDVAVLTRGEKGRWQLSR